MEQMTVFAPPYKYLIDSSSIFSQKPDEPHRRHIYTVISTQGSSGVIRMGACVGTPGHLQSRLC